MPILKADKVDFRKKVLTKIRGTFHNDKRVNSSGGDNPQISMNLKGEYMKQRLTESKGEIDKSMIAVEDFNTLLSVNDGKIGINH